MQSIAVSGISRTLVISCSFLSVTSLLDAFSDASMPKLKTPFDLCLLCRAFTNLKVPVLNFNIPVSGTGCSNYCCFFGMSQKIPVYVAGSSS